MPERSGGYSGKWSQTVRREVNRSRRAHRDLDGYDRVQDSRWDRVAGSDFYPLEGAPVTREDFTPDPQRRGCSDKALTDCQAPHPDSPVTPPAGESTPS